MMEELFLPSVVLMALGWLVPQWLRPWFPEGARPLVWLGVTAALILLVIATLAFVVAYAAQDIPLSDLFERPVAGLWHFLRLGLLSAMLWAPVMVLSVAQLPRKWKDVEW